MANTVEDITNELALLLNCEAHVLQELPPKYLAGIRSTLNTLDDAVIDYLRFSCTQPQRDLFLNHVVNPDSAEQWRFQLLTDAEKQQAKRFEETLEIKRQQELLFQQQLESERRLESERAQREEEEKANAEQLAKETAEKQRLDAEIAAAQAKAAKWHAARARTGF